METKEQPQLENGLLAVLQRKEIQAGTMTAISQQISDAAKAAFLTGKKATVSVTFVIDPKMNALNFGVKVKSTIPEQEQPLCIFYVDSDGKLSRNDPGQGEFNLSVHSGGQDEQAEATQAAAAAN